MILLICPKCRGQVEESYEDGPCCAECWRTGEPVRVEFELDEPADVIRTRVDGLVALERFKLAQIEREDEFRQAERDWYENLSVADRFWEDSRRKRVQRERIAALPPGRPLMRVMEMFMRAAWTSESLTRQLYGGAVLAAPKLRELDPWLAEDGPMPEVEAAFV